MTHALPARLLLILLLAATPALGQEEEAPPDARLDGYTEAVKLQSSSTATTWLLLIGLGVLCFGVMFKDSKRTHLD